MKCVMITGANRGLGKALLDTFRTTGWSVIATARDTTALPADASIDAVSLDLSSYGSVRRCAEEIRATGKTVDLLIQNAGYNPKDSKDDSYFRSTFNIAHFSGANVADSLHINALAPMELTSNLLPVLAPEAVVVMISSWLGSIGEKQMPGHYGYAGSKSLLNMFTKGMALEFAETSRVAVAINPGWMATSMGGEKATATPEHVAGQILSLYTTGTLRESNGKFLNVDGTQHPW